MTAAEDLKRDIFKVANEYDATIQEDCPVCGNGFVNLSKHMPKAHPKAWVEWKESHRKVDVQMSVWVEGSE